MAASTLNHFIDNIYIIAISSLFRVSRQCRIALSQKRHPSQTPEGQCGSLISATNKICQNIGWVSIVWQIEIERELTFTTHCWCFVMFPSGCEAQVCGRCSVSVGSRGAGTPPCTSCPTRSARSNLKTLQSMEDHMIYYWFALFIHNKATNVAIFYNM